MRTRGADWHPTMEDGEVRSYILEEVGEEGLAMARYLLAHPRISGVDLLENFKERKSSDVRKVLYRMMEAHCAEYAKDTDSKGWETFYWDLDLEEIKHILRRRWADELLSIRKQLRFMDDHQYYACSGGHRHILFEDAMEMGFKCPQCQKDMQPDVGESLRNQLEARVAELEPSVTS